MSTLMTCFFQRVVKLNESILRISIRESNHGEFFYDMQNTDIADIEEGLNNPAYRRKMAGKDYSGLSKL